MLKRRLLKDLTLYGTSDVVSKGLVFLALPIYTRIFTPAEYGALSLALTVFGLLLGILILGGDSAFALYYVEARTAQDRQALTSTALTVLVCCTGAFTLVALPLTPWLSGVLFGTSHYATLLLLAVVALPASVANRILSQVLRSQFRPVSLVTLTIGTALLSVGAGLFAATKLNMGLNGILLGTLIGEMVTLPLRVYLVRASLGRTFDRELCRKFLSYGLPLVPTAIAYWVFLGSDRVVLSRLSNLEQVGLYSVANGVVGVLLLATSAVGQAWSPHALQLATQRPEEAKAVFGRFLTYLLASLGFLCVAFTSFAPELLRVIASPRFYGAKHAVAPLALALVGLGTTQVTSAGICLKKRTRYLAIYSAYAAVLNVVLCILVIPRFGQVGAAWASTTAYVYLTVAYGRRSQTLWPVAYETRRSSTIVILLLGFSAAASVLPGPSLIGIALKLLYCMSFVAALFVFRALDAREIGLVTSVLGRGNRPAVTN